MMGVGHSIRQYVTVGAMAGAVDDDSTMMERIQERVVQQIPKRLWPRMTWPRIESDPYHIKVSAVFEVFGYEGEQRSGRLGYEVVNGMRLPSKLPDWFVGHIVLLLMSAPKLEDQL